MRPRLHGAFSALRATGTAQIASAYASYPLIRSYDNNLVLLSDFDYRTYRDKIGAVSSVTDKDEYALLVGISEGRLAQVQRHFDAHGGKTILIGRSIGLVRSLAPFVAGASRMPLRRFLPYTTIAAGLWGALLCVLGYLFWGSLDDLLQLISRGSIGLAVVAVVVAGAVIVYRQRGPAPQQ